MPRNVSMEISFVPQCNDISGACSPWCSFFPLFQHLSVGRSRFNAVAAAIVNATVFLKPHSVVAGKGHNTFEVKTRLAKLRWHLQKYRKHLHASIWWYIKCEKCPPADPSWIWQSECSNSPKKGNNAAEAFGTKLTGPVKSNSHSYSFFLQTFTLRWDCVACQQESTAAPTAASLTFKDSRYLTSILHLCGGMTRKFRTTRLALWEKLISIVKQLLDSLYVGWLSNWSHSIPFVSE